VSLTSISGKKVPEHRSGLLLSEKELPEWNSGAFGHKNTPGYIRHTGNKCLPWDKQKICFTHHETRRSTSNLIIPSGTGGAGVAQSV
jgi:hypothetical protein